MKKANVFIPPVICESNVANSVISLHAWKYADREASALSLIWPRVKIRECVYNGHSFHPAVSISSVIDCTKV